MRLIITFNNKNVELPEPWEPTPVGPPNDELWYTSTNRNIVTPNSTSALPTIVSNTYVDDKGIIKFESNITKIGQNAFKSRTNLSSITIPNSVTRIFDSAFFNSRALSSVEIPYSVTEIGWYTFQNCVKLTSISYTGTIAQYNAITKGAGWHESVPAKVVHCTDGDTPI